MSVWREPLPWASRVDRVKAIVLHTLDMCHGSDEEAKTRHIRALLRWELLSDVGKQALTELLREAKA